MAQTTKFTPPPLFNTQTSKSNNLHFTPASTGTGAGPQGRGCPRRRGGKPSPRRRRAPARRCPQ